MSGNWVQRGACAAADKWTRAGWALAGGADLVLELPTVWAASSAESFATGAVALLRACGVVDVLSFGSESGDPAALAAAAACLDSEAYRAGLSRFLDEGMPFAACRQAVVAALLGSERAKVLSRPNDNLGVEYLRAASALGWSPQVLAVPRQGAGHDAPRPAEGFASASILREWIAAGRRDLADCFLPAPWPEELEPASLSHLERALLARVRSLSQAEWALLPDSGVEEGLPARLVQAGSRALSVEEFLTGQDQAVLPRPPAPSPAVGLPGPDRRRPPGCPALPPGSGLHPTGAGAPAGHEGSGLPPHPHQAGPRPVPGRAGPQTLPCWRPAAPTCTACVSPLPAPADWSGPPAPS